ncbi:hypothetical protein [Hyalangium versicolor]|uniref:hypothetical protein n=1 Tax=Hyalangium versicolor TaxID=2861190 RepID=UPI001CCBA295|nr:hypothetical protein [Hyalangium versicolor]
MSGLATETLKEANRSFQRALDALMNDANASLAGAGRTAAGDLIRQIDETLRTASLGTEEERTTLLQGMLTRPLRSSGGFGAFSALQLVGPVPKRAPHRPAKQLPPPRHAKREEPTEPTPALTSGKVLHGPWAPRVREDEAPQRTPSSPKRPLHPPPPRPSRRERREEAKAQARRDREVELRQLQREARQQAQQAERDDRSARQDLVRAKAALRTAEAKSRYARSALDATEERAQRAREALEEAEEQARLTREELEAAEEAEQVQAQKVSQAEQRARSTQQALTQARRHLQETESRHRLI